MEDVRRCYIHVGLPKTGTSFVQSMLWASQEAVAEQGLDLAPTSRSDSRFLNEYLRDSLDPSLWPPSAFTVLDRLQQQVAAGRGTRVLISNEVLGGMPARRIPRLLEALDGFEHHVIVTVRDLARRLPSAWQQGIQGRETASLDEFVEDFMEPDRAAERRRRHDLYSVLDAWESHVPRERFHIVTVPKSGTSPDVLVERFCRVLGVDPASLAADSPAENSSLGVVQAELLRRVNVALGDRLPHRRAGYNQHGRDFLARKALLPQGGRPPRLPQSKVDWCVEASEGIISRLAQGPYEIIGDLDELRPDPRSFDTDGVEVSQDELLESSVAALADALEDRSALTETLNELQKQNKKLRRRLKAADSAADGTNEGTRDVGMGRIPGLLRRRLDSFGGR